MNEQKYVELPFPTEVEEKEISMLRMLWEGFRTQIKDMQDYPIQMRDKNELREKLYGEFESGNEALVNLGNVFDFEDQSGFLDFDEEDLGF